MNLGDALYKVITYKYWVVKESAQECAPVLFTLCISVCMCDVMCQCLYQCEFSTETEQNIYRYMCACICVLFIYLLTVDP